MNTSNFKFIFQNAFDTFKVFETIPFEISGILIEGHAKTIWQTLNHLVIWRAFQIQKIANITAEIDFKESESWITKLKPNSKQEWEQKITEFQYQTEQIKNQIDTLDTLSSQLDEKLKLIQDSSTHLAFHLGEIILIARQKNKYPKPNEMNQFLAE